MRVFLSIGSLLLIFGSVSAFVAPPSFAASAYASYKTTGDNVSPRSPLSFPIVNVPSSPLRSVAQDAAAAESFTKTPSSVLGSLWGSGGVLFILIQAFKHTLPSALEPIRGSSSFFSPLQWSAYVATVVIFAYGQGNRCLQQKLAPLVVKRSCNLNVERPEGTAMNFLLAPLYATGLITATKQRLIKSHSLIWGTAALQVALQRGMIVSHGPLLNILDAGFAAGFAWGAFSLVWQYLASFLKGQTPAVDAGLPPL